MLWGMFGCASESALPDAEAFQERMDAKAEHVVPAVDTALGGTLVGIRASFHSKSGNLGVWNYIASGSWRDIPLDRTAAADAIAEVLTSQGMDVTRDEEKAASDVRGIVDGIYFSFSVSAPAGTVVNVEIGSEDGLSSADGFAENAPEVDYAAFVA